MKSVRMYLPIVAPYTLTLLSSPLFAQGTIQAQVTGGGGSGKCTFEIRTGGTAEVEIRGSQGRVRAISGGPAQWVRLKCNQPLPKRPNNFRFQGIDGRGRQTLVRDPNSNNGIAVVRIEDNRGSMHGYTGDIMWNGGSGNPGTATAGTTATITVEAGTGTTATGATMLSPTASAPFETRSPRDTTAA